MIYQNAMAMLSVKVIPNAKKTVVMDWNNEVLRIRIAVPPVDGKANRADRVSGKIAQDQ